MSHTHHKYNHINTTVGDWTTRTKEVSGLAPLLRCDIVECPNEFNVHVDLPGVRSTDLEVEITESQLVIRGERHSDYTEDTDLVHRAERSYGKVTRTIPIPKHAETKDAVANFDHGVLHIAIPKIKGERHTDKRKLEIKASK